MPTQLGSQRDLSVLDRIPGRPRLLNAEVQAAIVAEIAKHGNHSLAAGSIGIGRTTMSMWLKRAYDYAMRLQAGEDHDDFEEPFLTFATEVAKAEQAFRARCVSGIVELGEPHDVVVEKIVEVTKDGVTTTTKSIERRRGGEWQAIAWVLARLSPEEYERVVRSEISGPDGAPIETEQHVIVKDESRERIARVVAAIGSSEQGARAGLDQGSEPGGSESDTDVVDAEGYEVQPPHANGKATGVPPPQ